MSADNWEPAPMPNENNAHEKRNAAIAAAKGDVRRERHTREPWRVHDDDVVSQAEGGLAVCVSAGLLENRAADARRIVACVNACAGIPTATLVSVPPGTVADWWTRMLRKAPSDYDAARAMAELQSRAAADIRWLANRIIARAPESFAASEAKVIAEKWGV